MSFSISVNICLRHHNEHCTGFIGFKRCLVWLHHYNQFPSNEYLNCFYLASIRSDAIDNIFLPVFCMLFCYFLAIISLNLSSLCLYILKTFMYHPIFLQKVWNNLISVHAYYLVILFNKGQQENCIWNVRLNYQMAEGNVAYLVALYFSLCSIRAYIIFLLQAALICMN